MGKKTKKRLSCFLCAMLLFVTGIETSAFTGVFAATARKIDVWDFGAVQESDTQLYNNHQPQYAYRHNLNAPLKK